MQTAFQTTPMNPPSTPLPARKSLRARGVLATLALLLYTVLAGLYVAGERMRINDSVTALEALSRHEKALALAEAAVSSALVDVNETSSAAHAETPPPADLRLYMESCAKLFAALDEFDPGYARLQRAIARSYDSLQAQPVRAAWIDLREAMARAADELDIRRAQLADQRRLGVRVKSEQAGEARRIGPQQYPRLQQDPGAPPHLRQPDELAPVDDDLPRGQRGVAGEVAQSGVAAPGLSGLERTGRYAELLERIGDRCTKPAV